MYFFSSEKLNIFSEKSKKYIGNYSTSSCCDDEIEIGIRTTLNFMVLPQNSAESLILPNSSWHQQLTYPELDSATNFSKAKEILEFFSFVIIFRSF